MELTIKIEDPEFEKSIISGVSQIKDDQIIEIICKCIEAFLMKENNMEKLLMTKPYYANEYRPTEWLMKLFDKYDGSSVDEMKEEVVKFLKEHYHECVFHAMVASFSKQLLSCDFKAEMQNAIDSAVNAMKGK